ncbi:hypothetical protein HYW82_02755 [Candidatus Peregrinibacteria bacterium]|nr:hypothetical protein [Candidatus Peregrinibacteria bacterium]
MNEKLDLQAGVDDQFDAISVDVATLTQIPSLAECVREDIARTFDIFISTLSDEVSTREDIVSAAAKFNVVLGQCARVRNPNVAVPADRAAGVLYKMGLLSGDSSSQ